MHARTSDACTRSHIYRDAQAQMNAYMHARAHTHTSARSCVREYTSTCNCKSLPLSPLLSLASWLAPSLTAPPPASPSNWPSPLAPPAPRRPALPLRKPCRRKVLLEGGSISALAGRASPRRLFKFNTVRPAAQRPRLSESRSARPGPGPSRALPRRPAAQD